MGKHGSGNQASMNAATQIAVIEKTSVVGITQTVVAAGQNGELKGASINSSSHIKKGVVDQNVSVKLTF